MLSSPNGTTSTLGCLFHTLRTTLKCSLRTLWSRNQTILTIILGGMICGGIVVPFPGVVPRGLLIISVSLIIIATSIWQLSPSMLLVSCWSVSSLPYFLDMHGNCPTNLSSLQLSLPNSWPSWAACLNASLLACSIRMCTTKQSR